MRRKVLRSVSKGKSCISRKHRVRNTAGVKPEGSQVQEGDGPQSGTAALQRVSQNTEKADVVGHGHEMSSQTQLLIPTFKLKT